MTPQERRQLVSQIPAGLQLEQVVCRKTHQLMAKNHPLTTEDWCVAIHTEDSVILAPGLYSADKAAQLRAQILDVSQVKAVSTNWCPDCGSPMPCANNHEPADT